jgi:16S rRNA (uracil1498-N3)-methyltransferase
MSGSIRLFVHAALATGAEVTATPGQAHYLGNVMRRAPGNPVRLFNGRDGEWLARIDALRRDRATLRVERRLRQQAPDSDLWLAFALLKRDSTDLLVRMATELGVGTFLPVLTDRTNAAQVNIARLASIATEAAEQSERLTVPPVHPPSRLPYLLAGWPTARTLFAAIERRGGPATPRAEGPAGLLIGPEGGFTDAEVDALGRHASVAPFSLGPRILRAETAAIAGLVLLQAPQAG